MNDLISKDDILDEMVAAARLSSEAINREMPFALNKVQYEKCFLIFLNNANLIWTYFCRWFKSNYPERKNECKEEFNLIQTLFLNEDERNAWNSIMDIRRHHTHHGYVRIIFDNQRVHSGEIRRIRLLVTEGNDAIFNLNEIVPNAYQGMKMIISGFYQKF
ncbi:hypothetical protein [Marinilabilia salmonicolor]|uniref:hypothetical protein n=1 Tax=Marinilabilia salmonicolor TaxID=989 RepID=UPI000299E5E7|nr:hypothetical protein [Marinilabilia salmonicolor]